MGVCDVEKLGRYQLHEPIGQGGMAKVYRATLEGPMGYSKEVAIKLIPPELAGNDNNLRSLVNEARIGGQLHDPNIVEVFELDQVDDTWFIAMELVKGRTLFELLRQCRATGTRLPRAVALEIAMQIVAGLNHAHTFRTREGLPAQLVHRDLKPANVIIGARGVVKIMDFGIARSSLNLYQTTTHSAVKGTPLYISPEQLQGLPLTPASDLFSFGAVLYEMITSKQLFVAPETWGVMQRVMQMSVDPHLKAVAKEDLGTAMLLGRCLERDPELRYPSARELFDEIAVLREQEADDLHLAEFVRYLRLAPANGWVDPHPGNPWRWPGEYSEAHEEFDADGEESSVSVRRSPNAIAAELETFGRAFFGLPAGAAPADTAPAALAADRAPVRVDSETVRHPDTPVPLDHLGSAAATPANPLSWKLRLLALVWAAVVIATLVLLVVLLLVKP
jgi:eukaryotic-like serine/threonine-protein kinase